MEIWMEYLVRHGLPTVCPYEPFFDHIPSGIIRETLTAEHRLWAYFLSSNRHHLRYAAELSQETVIWEERLLLRRPGDTPPLGRQMDEVFQAVPFLQSLWQFWTDGSIGRIGQIPANPLAHRTLL